MTTRIDFTSPKLPLASFYAKARCVERLSKTECAQEIITPVRQSFRNASSRHIDDRARGFHGSADARGRAITGRQYQKDFFDTDSHAAAKKEAVCKEDVAFAEPFAEKEIFAPPGKGVAHAIRCPADRKEKTFRYGIECVTATEKETVANASAKRNATHIDNSRRDTFSECGAGEFTDEGAGITISGRFEKTRRAECDVNTGRDQGF
jgi:hypothetical protein